MLRDEIRRHVIMAIKALALPKVSCVPLPYNLITDHKQEQVDVILPNETPPTLSYIIMLFL